MKLFEGKFLISLFCSFLFLCLVSCGGEESFEGADAPSGSDSAPVSEAILEEPTVLSDFSPQLISTLEDTDNTKRRPIKLNGLVEDVKNSIFYINDYILFDEKKGGSEKKYSAGVKFHITTTCIEPKEQNQFKKKMVLDYQKKLTLIQLIPEQMFFYGNPWWVNEEGKKPICSFQFTSRNDKGDEHYFELPQLIIESFEDSFNLSLIQQNIQNEGEERIKQFPILNFEDLSRYAVISGSDKINEIKLICEKVRLSFQVGGVRHYDLWKLQGWGDISDENKINQTCRFVSFNGNVILGVSQLFPLVFPKKGNISLEFVNHSELLGSQELEDKTQGFRDLKENFRNQEPGLMGVYHRVAGLKVKNESLDQVHLYIPQAVFDVNSDFIFKGSKFTFSRFPDEAYTSEVVASLGVSDLLPVFGFDDTSVFFNYEKTTKAYFTSQVVAENVFMERDKNASGSSVVYGAGKDRKILITLNPGHEWIFPLSIEILESCIFQNISQYDDKFYPLAMVFEGANYPAIYQVLSSKDFEFAEKTKIKNISWNKKDEKNSSAFYLEAKVHKGILLNSSGAELNRVFIRNKCDTYKSGLMSLNTASQFYMYELRFEGDKRNKALIDTEKDNYQLLRIKKEDRSFIGIVEDLMARHFRRLMKKYLEDEDE